MKSNQLSKRLSLTIGAAVTVALAVLTFWVIFTRQSVIEVRVDDVAESDKKVCYFVEPNFQLRWIHSVEKQWWEEQYVRENQGLLLTTTYLQAFGREPHLLKMSLP